MPSTLPLSARVAASPAVAGYQPLLLAVAVAACFNSPLAQAQPTGAQAIHGAASLSQQGNRLVVTTQNGAGTSHSAINWQSFSVPAGSTTQFNQPSAASTSINRVVGANPSAIFGTLSSNGKLVLVNPSGITVGAGAVVDTAGFTASTLRMSDADALNGRLRFEGGGGALNVQGQVVARAGDIVLIAPQMEVGAQAVVQAIGGDTVLAAGQKVEITGRGLEGILLQVQAPADRALNLGTLKGDSVGLFAGQLKHSGLVQAASAVAEGGKVVLKAAGETLVDGRITATAAGGKGGSIDVLGDKVALYGGAVVDASGSQGGGRVRVGGDYQGGNAAVPNASYTFVGEAASIRADAGWQGDGGRVIVWSDQGTRMRGSISARGGEQGGNGGFAEVSGKRSLEFSGRADLRAPRGAVGTLLLDPNDIEIKAAGPTTTDYPAVEVPGVGYDFGGGSDSAVLLVSDLQDQLALSNTRVTTAVSSSSGPYGGRITVTDAVNWTSGNALALEASNGIVLNADVKGWANASSSSPAGGKLLLVAHGADGIQQLAGIVQAAELILATDVGAVEMAGDNKVGKLAASVSSLHFRNDANLEISSLSNPFALGSIAGVEADGVIAIKTSGSLTLASGISTPGQVALMSTGGDINQTAGTVQASELVLKADYGSATLEKANAVGKLGASVDSLSFKNTGDLYIEALSNSQLAVSTNGVNATGGAASITTTGALNLCAGIGSYGMLTLVAGGDVQMGGMSLNSKGGDVSITAGTSGNGGILGDGYIRSGNAWGRDGGNVSLVANGTGAISVADIDTSGYGTTLGSLGTNGGHVTLSSASGSIAFGSISTLGACGSDGYTQVGGSGGKGGNVSIASTSGALNLGSITTNGGGGGSSYENEPVRAGGAGGDAGNVTVSTGGVFYTSTGGSDFILAKGGKGGISGSGTGGRGGDGGAISLEFDSLDSEASLGKISSRGGKGGDSEYGTGGNGGNAKSISIVGNGNMSLQSLNVSARGGDGGNTDNVDPAGSTGGNGADIQIQSNSGNLVLSGTLNAKGGDPGQCDSCEYVTSDSPAPPAGTGTGGSFVLAAPMGTVTITDTLCLQGLKWENAGNVIVSGASVEGNFLLVNKAGASITLNGGEAYLLPEGGLENSGTLTIDGTGGYGYYADLTKNSSTGTVDLLNGDLYTTRFSSNEGTLNVHGSLWVGHVDGYSTLSSGGGLTNLGTVTGSGTLYANLTNSGIVAPKGRESEVGKLTVHGDFIQTASGRLQIDIGGASVGQYDQLEVIYNTTLGGKLEANLVAPVPAPAPEPPGSLFLFSPMSDPVYVPGSGDTFNVIQSATVSGQFGEIQAPAGLNLAALQVNGAPAPVAPAPPSSSGGTGGTPPSGPPAGPPPSDTPPPGAPAPIPEPPPPPPAPSGPTPPPPPPPASQLQDAIEQQANQVTHDLNNVQTLLALLTQEDKNQRDKREKADISFTDTQCKP